MTLAKGEGDPRASEVIQRAIQDGEGNFDIRIVDALELGPAWFRRTYGTRWERALQSVLRSFRFGHRGRTSIPDWFIRRGCREVFRRLRESPPDLVIAMGTGAANLAALAKRDGWIAGPILAVQTRLEIESCASRREIDVFAVASEDSRGDLIAAGASPNRVVLCGYPIDPAFSLPFDVQDLAGALGLDARRPVVLVMASQGGSRQAAGIVGQLARSNLPLQAVVVAGRDPALKSELEALRGRVALDLHVFGWTDMVPELMSVADLLVTKPVPLPAAEALTRGLPMVLTPASTSAEERLSRQLEQAGTARRAQSLAELPQLVERLLTGREDLSLMAKRARELGRPAAAHAIAQVAYALLETSTYIDFLAVPPARPGESAYLM
jgi:processive 1,2-diacylglycerol beta-glucosyltransferase